MTARKRRFVFILGMHRSGTSCLTGALQASGLNLGEVNQAHRHNARGNRESMKVWRINDRILADNKGSWHEPPEKIVIQEEHKKRIAGHLSSFESSDLSGIKDPRILLIDEAWFSAAESFQLAGTFRHPLAVAISLQKRNSLPLEKGFQLWIHYNQRLLRLHKMDDFPVVGYDLDEPETYCKKVAAMAALLGLNPNTTGIRNFVSKQLQHYAHGAMNDIPESCLHLYSQLKRVEFIP
ncbi:hypothetical protein L0156_08335 [bacterium]|nr:hypothetical protein [bacterium]